jgi:hypothetical protein
VNVSTEVLEIKNQIREINGRLLSCRRAAISGGLLHNTLAGLQGGAAAERYHIFGADYNALTDADAQLVNLQMDKGPTFDHLHLTSGQLGFPAIQVASVDPNTLDDYEEGTWTPGISFGGASVGVTYDGDNGGYYTKIGNVVTISGYLGLTSKGSSVGTATLMGLPFTIANSPSAQVGMAIWAYHLSFANMFQGFGQKNGTVIRLMEITEAGALTNLTDAEFVNDTELVVYVTYRVI